MDRNKANLKINKLQSPNNGAFILSIDIYSLIEYNKYLYNQRGKMMTTINDETYQAFIEAGVQRATAKEAAKVITEIEGTLIKINSDLFWIKAIGAASGALIVTMLGWIITKLS